MDLLAGGSLARALSVLAAVGSAATVGLSASLQHRVAGGMGPTTRPPALLFLRLARRPTWVLGIGLSVTAFGMQTVAISLGGLLLVQPVVVTGAAFAVPIRAALEGRLPSRPDMAWTLVACGGLASFILAAYRGRAGGVPDDGVAVAFALATVAAALVTVTLAKRARAGHGRAFWYGTCAGLLFGLSAGLLRMVTGVARHDPRAFLLQWPLWGMTGVGLWALAVNQRAYQVARIATIMPVLSIVDVLTSVGFAAAVFGEDPATAPTARFAQLAGLVLMGVGLWQLARVEEIRQRSPVRQSGSGQQ